MGLPARVVLIGLVRLYQLSLAGVLGGQCRFTPSCSAYAESAIRSRGALIGSVLAAWRILRCSPLSRGGIDPAPRPRERLRQMAPPYDSVIPLKAKALR